MAEEDHGTVSFAQRKERCERAQCGRYFRHGYIAQRRDNALAYACSVKCADALAQGPRRLP